MVELQQSIQSHNELRELYLFANKIGEEGAANISAMIKTKSKLTCLGLANNKLGSSGAVEIAMQGLTGKNQMVKLSIENNGIGNPGVQAISQALKNCTRLQEIYLYNNDIDDDPLEHFVALLRKQQDIFAVGLEFNRIGFKGLGSILGALSKHSKLEKLYLN